MKSRLNHWRLALLIVHVLVFTVCCSDDGSTPVNPGGNESREWVVHADGSGDAATIQAAVDTAASGDVIILENGTFSGDGNRDIELGGINLTVKSRSGNPDSCVIDCGGTPSESHRAFYLHSNQDASTVIEGVMITNGNHQPGGGIRLDGVSPVIRNCVFYQNTATDGGGVAIYSGSNPTITDCVFRENTAGNSGAGSNLHTASATYTRCVFINNDAVSMGGGIRSTQADFTIIECTFYGNEASFGSGIEVRYDSNVMMQRCIVSDGQRGRSAVYCSSSTATLSCCNLYNNVGGDWVDCVAGQAGTDGNMSENPLFCDAAGGDLTLAANSPCLAAGTCGRIGALDQGCPAKTSILD
jgi:hypothetical protein